MIQELWDYWTCPSSIKQTLKYGYLSQFIGLKYRAKRCLKVWTPHIAQCHKMTIQSIESNLSEVNGISHEPLSRLNHVMILGSGELLEIPFSYLLTKVNRITLVDIIHSKKIRSLAQQYPKQVFLMEKDLSGLSQDLDKISQNKIFPPNSYSWKEPLELSSLPTLDLVISANLLSQLSFVPLNYFKKKSWPEDSLRTFQFEIQENHLSFLKKLPCPFLIFSDFSLEILNAKLEKLEEELTIDNDLKTDFINWSLSKKYGLNFWSWELAPFGECHKKYKIIMKVFCLSKEGPDLNF